MSKLTNALVPSVQRLIEALQVKVITYSELVQDSELFHEFGSIPDCMQGCYHPVLDMIVVKDEHLCNSTEIVLHEIIHWAGAESRLNRKWVTDSKAIMMGTASQETLDSFNDDRDTEEATAEIGMLKLVLVLGLNPAQQADSALDYLEGLLDIDMVKADKDSDKAVEYWLVFWE